MELRTEEQWVPPNQNIQNLFESAVAPTNNNAVVISEEDDRISNRDLEKLPSTLVKLIRNLDSIRADMETQKRELLRTNNEMKHAQNLLIRYAKKCIKQHDKDAAGSSAATTVGGEKTKKGSARGFARPTKVSNELCEFMGVPGGTLISRTDTIVFINKYIKDNELQDPENMQNIILDKKLSKLFGAETAIIDKISFFKMQKYLSQHFKKSVIENQEMEAQCNSLL